MKKIILVTLALMSINAYAYSDGSTFHTQDVYIIDGANSKTCFSTCSEGSMGETCQMTC
jgi:hypothetical protein